MSSVNTSTEPEGMEVEASVKTTVTTEASVQESTTSMVEEKKEADPVDAAEPAAEEGEPMKQVPTGAKCERKTVLNRFEISHEDQYQMGFTGDKPPEGMIQPAEQIPTGAKCERRTLLNTFAIPQKDQYQMGFTKDKPEDVADEKHEQLPTGAKCERKTVLNRFEIPDGKHY